MNLNSNHITTNLLTKGWLNISALTKGFILPTFQFIIKKKKSGGSSVGYLEEIRDQQHLIDDLKKLNKEEVDYIQVFVNWDKTPFKYGKTVYVELMKRKIEAQLSTALSESYRIEVELIEKNKDLE